MVTERPRLFTMKQACQYLNISLYSLRRLIYARKMKVLRPGHGFRLDREDLDQWVEATKRTL